MKANDLLNGQINNALTNDAKSRTSSGRLNLQFHAEIENSYFTGYGMLHGTDRTVGDFQIFGNAVMNNGSVSYDLMFMWNDKINPNSNYEMDEFYSGILHTLYTPQDYDVHIGWQNTYTIPK